MTELYSEKKATRVKRMLLIHDRIKYYRHLKKWEIKELAMLLQISKQTLGYLEKGTHIPNSRILFAFLESTDVNLTWLIGGYGDPISEKDFLSQEEHKRIRRKVKKLEQENARLRNIVFQIAEKSVGLDQKASLESDARSELQKPASLAKPKKPKPSDILSIL